MILLAEAASRTKKGGQELIGGLDVRVERNHFGRQNESFEANLDLEFLRESQALLQPFRGIFIRAPVVERVLPPVKGVQVDEQRRDDTIVAPSQFPQDASAASQVGQPVKILGTVGKRSAAVASDTSIGGQSGQDTEKIVAVQQENVFGTSFHPELSGDARIHVWWLQEIYPAIQARRQTKENPMA